MTKTEITMKYQGKLERRNGIFFNPADPVDAERLRKFDAINNKTAWVKAQLDLIQPTNGSK